MDEELFRGLVDDNHGVLRTADARTCMSEHELRWRLAAGKWQRPCRGLVVPHSGALTDMELLRVALERCGPKAALAGLTAAKLDQFKGFDDKPVADVPIYVLITPGTKRHKTLPELSVIVHYSEFLTEEDVHPARRPRRTRTARSLIDAASWMKTDRGAMAVLAAGVQQGKARVADLRAVLDRVGMVRRRGLMLDILGDIEGGAQALSELDFTRKVIRPYKLPEPSRQVARRDSRNRRRWIDVAFEDWKVLVEIDGAQHLQPLDQWDDMERDNDNEIDGHRVLRFPAWMVRNEPGYVAKKVLDALRRGGYRDG